METCPIHFKELREGKYGWYCPTKMEDGSWCKHKAQNGLVMPRASELPPVKPSFQKSPEERIEIRNQVAFKGAIELVSAELRSGALSREGTLSTLQEYHRYCSELLAGEPF